MQDRTPARRPVTVEAAVLENDHLKAVLPCPASAGGCGRFTARPRRELLFRNPALRIANLAIRGALVLRGGVEWNLGHTGHHVFTCAPLYCCRVSAPDGEEFLRMYQYEAIEGQVLQLDFHLPDGAAQLAVQVRIENTRPGGIASLLVDQHRHAPDRRHPGIFRHSRSSVSAHPFAGKTCSLASGICRMPFQPNLPGWT